MDRNLRVGVIGSCLSNLPSVFLMNDFGFPRLNNASVLHSDLFVESVIEGRDLLPDFETMRKFLDLPEDDSNNSFRYLLENYRDTAGLTEIDRDKPGIYKNLTEGQFDLFLLDNLADGFGRVFYADIAGRPAKFHFFLHLAGRKCPLHAAYRWSEIMTPEKSAANWLRIVDFLRGVQPNARIIFSLPFTCTVEDLPERKAFYDGVNALLPKALAERDVVVLPPLSPDPALWKMPDRKHFDIKVYKGLAGLIYTQIESGWQGYFASTPSARRVTEAKLPEWKPVPSLREVLAGTLAISPATIHEDSGVDRTENWDSLKQVDVMTQIEASFGIQASFDETMEANTVPAIRSALALRGIAAADDPECTSNIFHDVVTRAVAAPDALYARFIKGSEKKDISYGDLLCKIASVQCQLADVPQGGIVAIILDHSEFLYPAFLGAVLGNWVPTMLPPLTRKQDPAVFSREIEMLFQRVQPAAVITRTELRGFVPQHGDMRIICIEDLEPMALPEARTAITAPPRPVAKGSLAFLQHSSGTTGHKKGVMLSHDQVYYQASAYAEAIRMRTGDKVASWLPLYHDMGLLTSFIIPTIIGCPIISMDALEWVANPTMLLDEMEAEKAAFCWLPNFAFHHIVRSAKADRQWDLASLKAVISCSEPCRAAAFREFADRFGSMGCDRSKLGTSYAMAENVFAITQSSAGVPVREAGGPAGGYLSSGPLLPGMEVQIRVDGVAQPEGVMGSVWLRSPSMFTGYFRLPELTAERIVDGWYDTRDLGMLYNGELTVVGRTDDLIIISGKNVVAHELEDELNQIPGIAPGRILVTSKFDEAAAMTELLVLAEPQEGWSDFGALENAVRDRTFSLCGIAPRKVRVLPRGFLIKSTAGKIARTKSLEKFDAEFAG